jgi:hypothetical protein
MSRNTDGPDTLAAVQFQRRFALPTNRRENMESVQPRPRLR